MLLFHQVSFRLGSAGFMGIGAYTSALLTINFDVPIFIGVIAGALLQEY